MNVKKRTEAGEVGYKNVKIKKKKCYTPYNYNLTKKKTRQRHGTNTETRTRMNAKNYLQQVGVTIRDLGHSLDRTSERTKT